MTGNATALANLGIREHPRLRLSIGIPSVVFSSVALYVSPIHGIVATIVFLLLGPIIMALMWTKDNQNVESSDSSMKTSSRIWAGISLFACLWELGSYILSTEAHNDNAYPTISVLLGPLLKTSAGKGIFLLIWIGIGVQLMRLWRKR